MVSLKKILKILGYVLILGCWSYFVFEAGASRAVGRAAYENSLFVRLEEKCIASESLECLTMYWQIRAAAAADSARRANSAIVPNSEQRELEEYITWADKLQ